MATKPSIVFAHGLWADGSCFSKLIPTLQAEGHEVIAAQNSLDSLKGDVEAVQRALGRVSSPAILVGSFLRRNCHHCRGNRRARCRAGLYRGARAGRRRDVAKPAGQISAHRRLRPHRSRRRSRVAEAERHRVLRRRFARAGTETCLGDPRRASRGPLQPET